MRFFIKIVLLSLLFLSSCTNKKDNIVITKDFHNQEWQRFEFLEGDIEIKNAPKQYNIEMEVVVSEVYPNVYENHQRDGSLLFNMTIRNSDNTYRSRDYKFMLKDKDGFWKAEKKDGYYVFRLPIINEMTFGEDGTYHFVIENKYPKDPLYGIKRLTLKCIDNK